MKCDYFPDERYPTLGLDRIGSRAKDDSLVDVPPALLNAVQKAEHDLACAELAVLEHLEKTGQLRQESHERWLETLRADMGKKAAR